MIVKVYDVLLQEKGFIAASAAALRAKILASGDQDAVALLNKLAADKTQLAGLVSSSQGDPADCRKRISQHARATNQLEQEIVKRSSALAEEKTLSVVTWRDVQKTLKPGDAAVEVARFPFHNGKSFTSTVYYIALIVTPESKNPDFIVLGEVQKLESAPTADYRAHVGVLTAYEASQLDLENTEFAVLSACETGLGQQSNSEGVFGLRRGLQEAGADAVMMSMWPVPDRETQELMGTFYVKWLGGLDKPEALRQAQLQEREVVRQRHGKDLPFYWGAFVLISR